MKNISWSALKVILILSAINAVVLSIAFAINFPARSYIYEGDLYADFFKMILSYPGAAGVSYENGLGMEAMISDYIYNNPYGGVVSLDGGGLTHFHLTPLSTTFNLIGLLAMKSVGPQLIFYLAYGVLFFAVFFLSGIMTGSMRRGLVWFCCMVFAYPFLFALQRGNLHSAAAGVLIIFYIILLQKGGRPWVALILLAIAINIRPNALIFSSLLLLVYKDRDLLIKLAALALLSAIIFVLALIAAGWLYSAYTFPRFLEGLGAYHRIYVQGGLGNAYNSSIFMISKCFFGYTKLGETVSAVVPVICLLISALQYLRGKIKTTAYVYVACGTYMLYTSVFADYHLLVFIAPLMVLELQQRGGDYMRSNLVVFWVCCFILSPKNYIFTHGISLLVLLNPVVVALGIVFILYKSISAEKPATVGRSDNLLVNLKIKT